MLQLLQRLIELGVTMSVQLDDLRAKVSANTDAVSAAVALLGTEGPVIPQAEIDAISASVQKNTDALNAATGGSVAGTPATVSSSAPISI